MINKCSFKDWLEYANYGMDVDKKKSQSPEYDETPIKNLNIEYVVKDLQKNKLGLKEAINSFYGECQWGKQPGAIKLTFSPYAAARAVVRKLATDLKGESVWVCKKIIEVLNRFDKRPDTLSAIMWNVLKETDNGMIDAPYGQWDKLENLVLKLAHELRVRDHTGVLLFEGIRRLEENKHYIIHFGCKGMGVQRRGQQRLDQFQVECRYFPDNGYLKVTGNEIGDTIAKHDWKISPSQFSEYYMPSQPVEEILESVLVHLNSY